MNHIPLFYFFKSFLFPNSKSIAEHDVNDIFKKELDLISKYSDFQLDSGKNILIFGCGYNYPDVVLFSNITKNTVGIDIQESFYKDGLRKLISANKRDGFSTLNSIFRSIFIRRRYSKYHKYLRKFAQIKYKQDKLNIISVKNSVLPFDDEYFDVIISNAVFEHVDPLDDSIKELFRVAKKGSISIHSLHNYYSLSGSHVPQSLFEKYPWGHLLENNEFTSYLRFSKTFLNKIDPYTLNELFSRYFNVILFKPNDKNHLIMDEDSEFKYEGENLFDKLNSSDKDKLLKKYKKETLLSTGYIYICKK